MGKQKGNSFNQKGHNKLKNHQGVSKISSTESGKHRHPLGNKTRESDERKIFLRNKIEIKRLQSNVEKTKAIVQGSAPASTPTERKKKDSKEDLYTLKGAARPAAEFYAPKAEPTPPPRDLLEEYKGRLWEVSEGQQYLTALFEYGTALHNLMNKSKDAVSTFEEMLELDVEDHMRVKEQILRCYLDNADAVNARLLLDKYGSDHCTFFMYARALIEYLSFHLQEPGASEAIRNAALEQAITANPFIIWLIAYYDIFEVIIDENSEDLLDDWIQEKLNLPGSVEEAFTFFKNDISIWMEIEGIVDWVHQIIEEKELTPPEVTVALPDSAPTDEEMEVNPKLQLSVFHAMYLDMFKTGCEEIEQRLVGGGK